MTKQTESPQSSQPQVTPGQAWKRLLDLKDDAVAKAQDMARKGDNTAIRLCRQYRIPY